MLELKNIVKKFGAAQSEVVALNDVSVKIEKGDFAVLLGASGSGKSTLLNVMGMIENIDSGQITFNNIAIENLSEKQKTKFRRENIGFIFQQYHLLPDLTIKENIEVGLYLRNEKADVNQLLKSVDLEDKKDMYPYQLSGGQQQRIAIARGIAKKPKILFCDEPTGALDEKTGKLILNLLQKLNQELGMTIVMVTHNPGVWVMANKIIKMNSGNIIEIAENKMILSAEEVSWG
ncbi:MAG: ABC transporter ATP-binding protein [Culicoidibacterales bacterium]